MHDFAQSCSLSQHVFALNEGKKIHKCNICQKTFTQTGNMKKHYKVMHGNPKY